MPDKTLPLVYSCSGCQLACVKTCLAQQGVTPNHHLLLNEQESLLKGT